MWSVSSSSLTSVLASAQTCADESVEVKARVSTFAAPKLGSSELEYEDAATHVGESEFDGRLLRAAVADGATDGLLSGLWASTLCESFRGLPDRVALLGAARQTFRSAREAWPVEMARYIEARESDGRPLKWYEEAKLESGAFATFVGMQLTGGKAPTAWVFAVGDACLFQFRGIDLLTCFPVATSDEFGTSPNLVQTRGDKQRVRHLQIADVGVDDCLVLATDAVSKWILSMVETGCDPRSVLDDLDTPDGLSFDQWLSEVRASGDMGNDDVTILRVNLHEV